VGTVGVFIGDGAQPRLVLAEELSARPAFTQEALQLQREGPGIKQAHERRELHLGLAAALDHPELPAQGVLDDDRIGLECQDGVGVTGTRREKVGRELAREQARIHVPVGQGPLGALDGKERAAWED